MKKEDWMFWISLVVVIIAIVLIGVLTPVPECNLEERVKQLEIENGKFRFLLDGGEITEYPGGVTCWTDNHGSGCTTGRLTFER